MLRFIVMYVKIAMVYKALPLSALFKYVSSTILLTALITFDIRMELNIEF